MNLIELDNKSPRIISIYAFLNRFTMEEKVSVEMSQLDDVQKSLQERMAAASLRVMMRDLLSAQYVDLDLDSTRSGIKLLEDFSILSPGRSAEILDAVIQDSERP